MGAKLFIGTPTFAFFHGHHSHFRNYFQMLLAVNEGEVKSPHHSLGHIQQQQRKYNVQNSNPMTGKIMRGSRKFSQSGARSDQGWSEKVIIAKTHILEI